MKRNIDKNILRKIISSATICLKKVAGLVMESIKKFWLNWQWVLALCALLWGIFLFYYKSGTENPARIAACEKHLAEHITKSDSHFERIDKSIADLNVINAGIDAKLEAIREDTNTTKKLVFELLGKRL